MFGLEVQPNSTLLVLGRTKRAIRAPKGHIPLWKKPSKNPDTFMYLCTFLISCNVSSLCDIVCACHVSTLYMILLHWVLVNSCQAPPLALKVKLIIK